MRWCRALAGDILLKIREGAEGRAGRDDWSVSWQGFYHPWVSAFTLNAVCLVPLVALKFSWTVQFQKLRMVRGAVFKEAPSNSIYISGSCSVDAPSEPQWCCQWISCAHIPVSFVISSACFLLIKLAILLSPGGGWQTDRHTRNRAGGQEWQVGRVWWWQTGRRWRGVARVLEKVTAPQTPLFVWRSHS